MMVDRYQGLGLSLLMSLGLVVGEVMPGMTNAVVPLVAQISTDEAQQAFDEAFRLYSKQDLASMRASIDYFEKALQLSKKNSNLPIQGFSLLILDRIYGDLGETKKSIDYSIQGQMLLEGKDRKSLQDSIVVFEKALQASTQSNNSFVQGMALFYLGRIYDNLGEREAALESYNKVLVLSRAINYRAAEAATFNYIGNVYAKSGEKQQALDSYDQGLRIYTDLKHRVGESYSLNLISIIYFRSGRFQEALEFQNKALSIGIAAGERYGELDSLNYIGMSYSNLGDKQKALEFYSKSLSISREIGDRLRESFILHNIASAYESLGNNKEALEIYNQSLQIIRSIGDRSREIETLNNIGAVYANLNENQKALDFYNQALSVIASTDSPGREATVLSNIAVLISKQGDRKQVVELLGKSLVISRNLGDRPVQAKTLYNITINHVDGSNYPEALQTINSAIDIIESLRSEFNNDNLKTAYFRTVQNYYTLKVKILMLMHFREPQKGYDIAALETVDQSRGRVLRELLIQSKANLYTNIDPDLLKQEQTLNQRIDAGEQQLTKPNARPEVLKQMLVQLYADRDDLKNKIRAKNPAYASLQYPKPTKLAELQQQLDPDTLMLQYSLDEEKSYLWVISNTAVKTYILPKRSDIEASAQDFMTAINSYPQDLGTTTLTQKILTPAADTLRNKRLVIIPDGILHTVPFAALNKPNTPTYTPLLTEHEITYLPSASTIGILRTTVATKPRAKKTIAILADPVFNIRDDRLKGKTTTATNQDFDLGDQADKILKRRFGRNMNFDRLPGTATEANGILSLVPDERNRTSAFGFDANYEWVTSPKLNEYRYIHLATHGFFDGNAPAFSSIVLSSYDSQGRDRKAYLRLPEIFNLNLSAELVTLSACQTGLGTDVPGEGSMGMTRGLMYAGALRVSTTLWKVDDEATAQLMQEFYKDLWQSPASQSRKSHAAALRSAQLKLWKEGKVPSLWAAFTLQGEWRD